MLRKIYFFIQQKKPKETLKSVSFTDILSAQVRKTVSLCMAAHPSYTICLFKWEQITARFREL